MILHVMPALLQGEVGLCRVTTANENNDVLVRYRKDDVVSIVNCINYPGISYTSMITTCDCIL